MTMNKKKMNAAIDQALAEKIQLLANDPGFPTLTEGALEPRELVRTLWKLNGWEPELQPAHMLRFWAAAAIFGLAEHIAEETGESVDYVVLTEFSAGFWDRQQALNSSKDELFFRFHTYAALFGIGRGMLEDIADGALEMVVAWDQVEINYSVWDITRGLAA